VKSALNIAICQMTSVDDVSANLNQIEMLLESISGPVDLACFPENCLYMRLKEGSSIPGLDLEDLAFEKLKELAKQKSCFLHLGSIPLREGSKLTNASVLVSPDGKVECTYRKMHLFDITLEGQKPVRESDVFLHGPAPSLLDVHSWKIGQTICYDVRFSELFSVYAKQGADVILVPSAFLVATGHAHWEVLLRARAIESQCYIVAAAQAGTHVNSAGDQRKTFGHSLVVNPWGEIVYQAPADTPQAHVLQLDQSLIEKVRRQIPMRSHRRF
jgi:predicted amidohydrolase